jgi:Ca2+-binding RTX toxin-like protein
MSRLTICILLACTVASFSLGTGAAAEAPPYEPPPSPPGCRYLSAGPAGPRGNVLLIDTGVNHIVLRREGETVLVAFLHNDEESVLDCESPQATVRNVDRIVYLPPGGPHIAHRLTIDESRGILQPGASPEPGGDEIEIVARFPKEPAHKWSSIFVAGTAGVDRIRIGSLRHARTGVNLDVARDGPHPDVDLYVSAARRAHFQLEGELGNDLLAASGRGSEFIGPMSQGSLSLRGEEGNDLLIGGPQRDHIRGQEGEDLIYGQAGNDDLTGDEGDDRLFGGKGEDRLATGSDEEGPFYDFLSGGPDRDALHSIDENRDKVLCGPGPDQAYVDQVDDWSRATCEKQHGPGFPR